MIDYLLFMTLMVMIYFALGRTSSIRYSKSSLNEPLTIFLALTAIGLLTAGVVYGVKKIYDAVTKYDDAHTPEKIKEKNKEIQREKDNSKQLEVWKEFGVTTKDKNSNDSKTYKAGDAERFQPIMSRLGQQTQNAIIKADPTGAKKFGWVPVKTLGK